MYSRSPGTEFSWPNVFMLQHQRARFEDITSPLVGMSTALLVWDPAIKIPGAWWNGEWSCGAKVCYPSLCRADDKVIIIIIEFGSLASGKQIWTTNSKAWIHHLQKLQAMYAVEVCSFSRGRAALFDSAMLSVPLPTVLFDIDRRSVASKQYVLAIIEAPAEPSCWI